MIEYRYAIEDFEESILFREHDTIKHMNSRYMQPIKIELPGADFMQQVINDVNKVLHDKILEDLVARASTLHSVQRFNRAQVDPETGQILYIRYDPIEFETDYYL